MARHKEFEPEAVLDEAISLFWERGYGRTSMSDLVERMGVHKRSMYDTFGDKRTLFLQALSKYAQREHMLQRETANAPNCRSAIRSLLESAIVPSLAHPAGCLLVNCAVEDAAFDEDIARHVRATFTFTTSLFLQVIMRGQEAGEIQRRYSAAHLAAQLFNTWLSVRVQVRAGVEVSCLREVIDIALEQLN